MLSDKECFSCSSEKATHYNDKLKEFYCDICDENLKGGIRCYE